MGFENFIIDIIYIFAVKCCYVHDNCYGRMMDGGCTWFNSPYTVIYDVDYNPIVCREFFLTHSIFIQSCAYPKFVLFLVELVLTDMF